MQKIYTWFRYVFAFSILGFGIFSVLPSVQAQESETNVYFFHTDGCPHCADEWEFLNKLTAEDPSILVTDYEMGDEESRDLIQEVSKISPKPIHGVPLTIIGETFISGYFTDETTGVQISEAIERLRAGQEIDVMSYLLAGEDLPEGTFFKDMGGGEGVDSTCELDEACFVQVEVPESEKIVDLPLFGQVNTRLISLPLLTIMIGFLDGFNPCAMWVLIFLITLLMGMKDRRRMWLLGSAFIVASGFVYFLLLGAWLNLFLFVGYLRWIQIIIGLVALGGATWYLYDGITNPQGVCKVSGGLKKKKIFEKLKEYVRAKNIWWALGGVILLAFVINILEGLCSAGLPAVYTQVLALNDLPTMTYYGYLLLYVLVFMIDDMFVFAVAMLTLKHTVISTKYARYSHLIGGFILLVLGLLLILKPGWLLIG